MEKLCSTPENREKHESLAQQLFPRLWYIIIINTYVYRRNQLPYSGKN